MDETEDIRGLQQFILQSPMKTTGTYTPNTEQHQQNPSPSSNSVVQPFIQQSHIKTTGTYTPDTEQHQQNPSPSSNSVVQQFQPHTGGQLLQGVLSGKHKEDPSGSGLQQCQPDTDEQLLGVPSGVQSLQSPDQIHCCMTLTETEAEFKPVLVNDVVESSGIILESFEEVAEVQPLQDVHEASQQLHENKPLQVLQSSWFPWEPVPQQPLQTFCGLQAAPLQIVVQPHAPNPGAQVSDTDLGMDRAMTGEQSRPWYPVGSSSSLSIRQIETDRTLMQEQSQLSHPDPSASSQAVGHINIDRGGDRTMTQEQSRSSTTSSTLASSSQPNRHIDTDTGSGRTMMQAQSQLWRPDFSISSRSVRHSDTDMGRVKTMLQEKSWPRQPESSSQPNRHIDTDSRRDETVSQEQSQLSHPDPSTSSQAVGHINIDRGGDRTMTQEQPRSSTTSSTLAKGTGSAVTVTDSDVLLLWHAIGEWKELRADADIARYLLSLFFNPRLEVEDVQTSNTCVHCSCPLTMCCVPCLMSTKQPPPSQSSSSSRTSHRSHLSTRQHSSSRASSSGRALLSHSTQQREHSQSSSSGNSRISSHSARTHSREDTILSRNYHLSGLSARFRGLRDNSQQDPPTSEDEMDADTLCDNDSEEDAEGCDSVSDVEMHEDSSWVAQARSQWNITSTPMVLLRRCDTVSVSNQHTTMKGNAKGSLLSQQSTHSAGATPQDVSPTVKSQGVLTSMTSQGGSTSMKAKLRRTQDGCAMNRDKLKASDNNCVVMMSRLASQDAESTSVPTMAALSGTEHVPKKMRAVSVATRYKGKNTGVASTDVESVSNSTLVESVSIESVSENTNAASTNSASTSVEYVSETANVASAVQPVSNNSSVSPCIIEPVRRRISTRSSAKSVTKNTSTVVENTSVTPSHTKTVGEDHNASHIADATMGGNPAEDGTNSPPTITDATSVNNPTSSQHANDAYTTTEERSSALPVGPELDKYPICDGEHFKDGRIPKFHPFSEYKCSKCDYVFTNKKHIISHIKNPDCSIKIVRKVVTRDSEEDWAPSDVEFSTNGCAKDVSDEEAKDRELKMSGPKRRRIKVQNYTLQDFMMGMVQIPKTSCTGPLNTITRYYSHYTCKQCYKVFISKQEFESHCRDHSKDKEVGTSQSHIEREQKGPDPESLKILMDIKERLLSCCQQCDRVFTNAGQLKSHSHTHNYSVDSTGMITCIFCGASYDNLPRLLNHQKIRKGNKVCKVCGLHFKINCLSKAHKKEHREQRKCKVCDESFTSLSKVEINRHMKAHTERNNRSLCPVCGQSMLRDSLAQHMVIHSDERPFSCSVCSKTFKYKFVCENHERLHKEKSFQCETCGMYFHHMFQLRKHTAIKHQGKWFECNECGKKLAKSKSLRQHILTVHRKLKPYACATCGLPCSSLDQLKDHEKLHTGEKPYQCQYCPSRFAKRAYLKVHVRTHTGEKPYQCDDCGQSFTSRSGLTLHRRNRHSDKIFPCTECGENFPLQSSLDYHRYNEHGGNHPILTDPIAPVPEKDATTSIV